jgi:hypothetical protein
VALDHLGRLDDFDPKQGMVQTAYYLNRWIEHSEAAAAWQPDPLTERLPAQLRTIAPVQELAKRQFTVDDVRYLREASWARSISKWVAARPDEPDLAPWLKQLEAVRGEPHAYELSLASRLFDWTVRNIQLDSLLPFPGQAADSAGESPPRRTGPRRTGPKHNGRRYAAAAGNPGSRLQRFSLADTAVWPRRCLATRARVHAAVPPATDRSGHAGF